MKIGDLVKFKDGGRPSLDVPYALVTDGCERGGNGVRRISGYAQLRDLAVVIEVAFPFSRPFQHDAEVCVVTTSGSSGWIASKYVDVVCRA